MRALALDFSKVLKKFREDAKLSQDELAHRLNITQSHVSKYECNRKVIDLDTFMRWVHITNAEAQAALVMFGTDVILHASQLVSLTTGFIFIKLQIFM
ncbi:hypothetical protein A0U40_12440 [[Bacillus] sp. KCTC 13219]|nr:hypothetical protein A0U40_12440 [[Bacillus] sp. KCTC 13219]